MQIKRLSFALLFSLVAICSCVDESIDDNINGEVSNEENIIEFSATIDESGDSVSAETKGTPITVGDDVSSIGIFTNIRTTVNEQTSLATYLSNSEVVRNIYSKNLEFVNITYWPSLESNQMLGFIAYSPYTDVYTVTDESDPNYGKPIGTTTSSGLIDAISDNMTHLSIHYTVPETVEDQPDLLVSYPVEQASGAVSLTFKHALATVEFNVIGDGISPVSSITMAEIGSEGTMEVTYDKTIPYEGDPYYDGDIVWTLATDETTGETITRDMVLSLADKTLEEVYPDDDDLTSINTTSGYLMMIPQTVYASSDLLIEFADGGSRSVRFIDDQVWKAGGKYRYNIQIDFEGEVVDYSDKATVNALVGYENAELETANCYILNPPVYSSEQEAGTDGGSLTDEDGAEIHGALYYIPITSRMEEYYVTYAKGTEIPAYSNWSPVLLWHDCEKDPIEEGVIIQRVAATESGEERFSVYIPYQYKNVGNMTIGVMSDEGPMLWSWHLWITDYNPYNDSLLGYEAAATGKTGAYTVNVEGGELHHYRDTEATASTYYWSNEDYYRYRLIMDRNLGAWDNEGGAHDASDRTPGLFYQFGRKDPFPRGVNNYSEVNREYDPIWATVALLNSLKYPAVFNANNSTWCSDVSEASYVWGDSRYLTDTNADIGEYYKSLFDPSPVGFMVPTINVWNDFTYGNPSTGVTLISDENGITYSYNSAEASLEARYPLAASLYSQSNTKYGAMSDGTWSGSWSAMPSDTANGKMLGFKSKAILLNTTSSTTYYNYKAWGHTVRPIQRWYGAIP